MMKISISQQEMLGLIKTAHVLRDVTTDAKAYAKMPALRKGIERALSTKNLNRLKQWFHASDEMLCTHIPIGNVDLEPTPSTENEIRPYPPAYLLLGYFACMGLKPVAYPEESDGQLQRIVAPLYDKTYEVSSQGSVRGLSAHSDNPNDALWEERRYAGGRFGPTILALACLRNPDSVPTQFILLDNILEHLSDEDRRLLMDRAYVVPPPQSVHMETIDNSLKPVLVEEKGVFHVRWQSDIRSASAAHQDALARFAIAIEQAPVMNFIMQPGAAIFFKNSRLLHARPHFEPDYCSKRARFLIRIYAVPQGGTPWLTV